MDGRELTSKLMELDDRDFVSVGRVKPYAQNMNIRLLLLEMGVHLMDEGEMSAFRECHGKATKMRAERVFREKAKRAESLKRELNDAVEKVKGRIVVLNPGERNITVEGTRLVWDCPRCKEHQEVDLSKMENDPKFLKVNGKYRRIRGRVSKGPIPRVVHGDKHLFKGPATMSMNESSMSRRSVGIVSMPPGQSSAAVIRLARGDTINFEFGCGKCNFRNRGIKIGVGE